MDNMNHHINDDISASQQNKVVQSKSTQNKPKQSQPELTK